MRGLLSALFTLLYPWTCLTMAVVFYGTDMIGPDPEDRDYNWIKAGLKLISSSKPFLPVQDAGWRVFYQWLPNVFRITRGWLATVRESGCRPRSKARQGQPQLKMAALEQEESFTKTDLNVPGLSSSASFSSSTPCLSS